MDTVLSPASRRLLRIYLRPLRTRVALLAALLVLGVALQLLNPQIVRAFIDTAQAGGAQSTLVGAALLFLGVAVATQVAGVAEAYVAADVGWRATNALRLDLARHCLGLDPGFHHAHTPGELIARVDGDVSTLANFLSRFVLLVLGSLLLLVGVLALLFREDWRLGLLFTLLSAVGLAASFWVRRITSRYAAAQRQAVADLEGFVEERLYALPDVRANAMQPHVLYRLGLALRETYLRARAMVVAGNTLGWVTGATGLLSALLTLGAGAALYSRGEITLGTVYLLFQYQALLRRPLGEMTRQLQDFQRAGASVERVQRLADIAPTVPDGPGRPSRPAPWRCSSMRWTSPTLRRGRPLRCPAGVGFAVRPGEVLGLLGRTGSGKTTIARLLLRLYDPDRRARPPGRSRSAAPAPRRSAPGGGDGHPGRAALPGHGAGQPDPLRSERPGGQRAGGPGAPGPAPLAGASPAGLDTPLGPGGEGSPPGEAQLLAFGRVFLRDPRVVVLDEASSRLDPATERLIAGAVDRLLEGRTGIVVAHRLETVQRADAVLVLEGGRVAEWGPRAALGADPRSRYAPSCGALTADGGGAGVTRHGRLARHGRRGRAPDRLQPLALRAGGGVLHPGLRPPGGHRADREAFFDTLSGSAPAGPGIWTVIALFGAVGVAEMLSNATLSYGWITFLHRSMALLRRTCWRDLVLQPQRPHRREAPGAALNRIMGDSEEVVESVDAWIDMVGRTVFVVGAVTVMLRIDATLTLVVLLPLTVIVTAANMAEGRIERYRRETREASGEVTGFLGEVFGAAQAVQLAGATPHAVRRLMTWASAGAAWLLRDRSFYELLEAFNWNVVHLGTGVVLLLAGSAMRGRRLHRGRLRPLRHLPGLGDVLPHGIARWLTGYRQAGVSASRLAALVPGSSAASLAHPTPLPFSGPVPAPPARGSG